MATFVLNTPCRAYRSWEATKEQTADLYHRILTSAGYSASSLEKYHYLSDCHRHARGNLTLIPGVLAVLRLQSYGVPDKVAIIRINVLVTCIFSFKFQRKAFHFVDWNYSLHLFGIAQAFDTLFFINFFNYFF